MKNCKTKFVCLIVVSLSILFFNSSKGQSIGQGELMIVNKTGAVSGKLLKVNIYPVGAIFSGGNQYSLDATNRIPGSNGLLIGYSDLLEFNQSLPEEQWTTKINFDASDLFQGCETSLGYGKYRIDFYEGPDQANFLFVDYCIIDFSDANYGRNSFQGEQRLKIDYNSSHNITFNFLSSSVPNNISVVSKQIRVWEQYGSGFPAVVPSKGLFNDTTLIQYHNFPIDARDFGAVQHLDPGDFGMNMIVKYQGANVKQNNVLKFNRTSLTINNGIIFTVNPSQELNITGKGGNFITKPTSKVIVPDNFAIKINDSAGIDASGTIFTKSSGANSWRGIRLDNVSPQSSISGCEISFADTGVTLTNQQAKAFSLRDNTFNIQRSSTGAKVGFFSRNSINILIEKNNFNLPSGLTENFLETAVHILNYLNYSNASRVGINIHDNNFYNGRYQILILAYASILTKVSVKLNEMYDGDKNLVLRRCTGDVKDNLISNSAPIITGLINMSTISFQGVVNFYANKIFFPEYNLISGGKSYSNLAPVKGTGNTLIWTGGYNKLANLVRDNIYTDQSGYVYLNEGKNSFTISGPPSRHIFGLLDDTCTQYFANNNCWFGNNNEAVIEVYRTDLYVDRIPHEAIPNPECETDNIPDFILSENDFGIRDTLFISHYNSSPGAAPDEIMYSKIVKDMFQHDYSSAKIKLRNFINNYPDSKYLNPALYKIFECYDMTDNSQSQAQRNILFGELKSYLENKIISYQYNTEFVKLAYDIVLMCATIKTEYQEALSGYEFLSYNEDGESLRLLAASDYLTVSSMMNGTGGAENNKSVKTKKFSDLRPVNKIIERVYGSEQMKSSSKKADISGEIKNPDTKVSEILNCKNMSSSDKLHKVEKEALSFLDANIIAEKNDNSLNLTNEFSLLQNYPNPFNPATRIYYNIVSGGNVKIQIYNSIGQKVKDLVNEFKVKGNYSIEFDGSELSSGIYYYQMEINDFVQTNKMMLLK